MLSPRNQSVVLGRLALGAILSALLLVVSAVGFWRTYAMTMHAYRDRFACYLLADELRQSSDDLTRLVRTYAATGDARFDDWLEALESRTLAAVEREESRARLWAAGFALSFLFLVACTGTSLWYYRTRIIRSLRESEGRFRKLFESAGDAMMLMEGGRFTDVNHAATIHFRCRREDLVGQVPSAFSPPHQPDGRSSGEAAQARLREAADSGHVLFEWQHLRADGSPFDAEVGLTRLRLGHGEFLLATVRDVSARKRAEESLRALTATLEQRVVARTSQLEAANQELEAFSYSVSHDLRAPLRHVSGFSDMLHKHAGATLDEKGRHYLDTIREASQKMGRLIDDLLVFSRMGRVVLSHTPVDLRHLLDDVIHDCATDLKDRRVTWDIGSLPVVQGDPSVLRQVFANLIDNALKYSRPRPETRIQISSREEGGENIVCVRDNGVGFDMRYVDKLFGVFQRLHGESEFEGTGIGLANVRRIIQRHGGRTWAESRPGEGAAIYFSLPTTTIPKEVSNG